MIAVGLLRWFLNMQREEIQLLFYARGTNISTGEISNLSEEFLLRFYIFHKKHIVKIKSLFNKNGGMILHLDGTGEAGDDIVFTAEDGRTGIKIDAQIMPSESSKFIKPFLQSIKNTIGTPLGIIRDMSKNIQDAATEIFPGTPQLICHYHFVSNLGKLIFKEEYEIFRKKFLSTKILAHLASLKKDLSEFVSFKSLLVEAQCKWVALAIEYLLWPREPPSGFPFVLPYYEIMNRTTEIKNLIKKIIEWNVEQNFAVKAVLELHECIEELRQIEEIKTHYFRLEIIWNWCEKVSKILEVTRHLKDDGQKTQPKSAVEIKNSLQKLIIKIKKEAEGKDKKIIEVSGTIIGECEDHWEELTGEIKDTKGNDVGVVRHNGILETNHRWSRMHTRRRTGRSRTTNDMAKYGALTAVLSNLENESYVKEVLRDIPDFVYEMQSIDGEEIEKVKELIKPYHNDFLVSSDSKRISLLQDFITILERSDKKDKIDINIWLNSLE
jgi:hypothetical protein